MMSPLSCAVPPKHNRSPTMRLDWPPLLPPARCFIGGQCKSASFCRRSPCGKKYITNGFETEPLLSLISKDYTIGIVLVRIGHFSVGVCQGENCCCMIREQVWCTDASARAVLPQPVSSGGAKDQTHHFLERVSTHLREQLEPYARTLDYFIYGGAKVTILRLQKQCPFLAQFDDRLLPPLLEFKIRVFPSWRRLFPISGPVRSPSGKKKDKLVVSKKSFCI